MSLDVAAGIITGGLIIVVMTAAIWMIGQGIEDNRRLVVAIGVVLGMIALAMGIGLIAYYTETGSEPLIPPSPSIR